MLIEDRVVVVTGAAGGIGRALAERFHADGARGVILSDRDPAVGGVAATLGDRAVAVVGDATAPSLIDELCATAAARFGPVDLFCANAGIAVAGDEQVDDAGWAASFAVNVDAHVRAARRLVPEWLERGEGYFLSTASAAGLLTQIGSAPYAVSKHAAVAFAEWLAVTYGSRGIRVSCLCPMGVETALLADGFDGAGSTAAAAVRAAGAVLTPEAVADVVVNGLRDERFLILPHPEVHEYLRRKADDPDRWIAGMQRLQRSVDPSGTA